MRRWRFDLSSRGEYEAVVTELAAKRADWQNNGGHEGEETQEKVHGRDEEQAKDGVSNGDRKGICGETEGEIGGKEKERTKNEPARWDGAEALAVGKSGI